MVANHEFSPNDIILRFCRTPTKLSRDNERDPVDGTVILTILWMVCFVYEYGNQRGFIVSGRPIMLSTFINTLQRWT